MSPNYRLKPAARRVTRLAEQAARLSGRGLAVRYADDNQMKRSATVSVLALALAATCATAAEPESPPSKNTHFVAGGQVTTPQQLSVSVGTIISVKGSGFESGHHGSEGEGILLQIEPGLGGLKGPLGYGFVGGVVTGSARLSVLRTWGDPWGADGDETYLGPEVTATYIVKMGVGALYRVSGDQRNDWILTASLGVGF